MLWNQNYVLLENDMIKEWLDYSNESIRNFPKPCIDEHTTAFVMYCCEKLDVGKEVFFMTVDTLGKYLEVAKQKNIDLKEPILIVLVLILICNKHTGQRSNLTGSTIVTFMQTEGLKKYHLTTIQNMEKIIMKNLNCHISLLSTMDDLNVLIEYFFKPPQFIKIMRKQCLDILNLFYLNAKNVVGLLDELYSKTEEKKLLLQTFYDKKLYFPAGVLLCALKISKDIKLFDYENTRNKISAYTKIPVEDLTILSSIMYNLIHILIGDK